MKELIQKLCEFAVEAKCATYAAGDSAQKTKISDGSTTIEYENGNWRYHDNYFGGEPYGGREVIFYKNDPIWLMVYYGEVDEFVSDVGGIYEVLRGALSFVPVDAPYRGPREYRNKTLLYQNDIHGEMDRFHGEEYISKNGKIIYSTRYGGGLVDIRKDIDSAVVSIIK